MKKELQLVKEGENSFGWPDDWGNMVRCPICGFDYVHADRATNTNGNDAYLAWDGRGDAIKIPMWCENGHQWMMIVGHHKGNTYLFNAPHPEGDEFELVEDVEISAMKRDVKASMKTLALVYSKLKQLSSSKKD